MLSMLYAPKALLWHLTAEHYCFCRVHWHLYIFKNVCENEMMRYIYAVGRIEGRSYLSVIQYDRLISEILNCSASLIPAEMKVVAMYRLFLSDVWMKTIYSFAKALTYQSYFKMNDIFKSMLFQINAKLLCTVSVCNEIRRTKKMSEKYVYCLHTKCANWLKVRAILIVLPLWFQ